MIVFLCVLRLYILFGMILLGVGLIGSAKSTEGVSVSIWLEVLGFKTSNHCRVVSCIVSCRIVSCRAA